MKIPAKLDFFDVSWHCYEEEYVFDASHSPRPRFCMGFLLEGEGVFHDCTEERDIAVSRGEIIFVPMGARYISHWKREGGARFISMHFAFDSVGAVSAGRNFFLQKVKVADPVQTERDFAFALAHSEGTEEERLAVLGVFYRVLAELLPLLSHKEEQRPDPRIADALAYIDAHYREAIRVEELAMAAHMSLSRFFPCFRREMGVTPVEYVNCHRVNRAAALLLGRSDVTVEQISELVGFESSAYFRRVFKHVMGVSPREYRATSAEI